MTIPELVPTDAPEQHLSAELMYQYLNDQLPAATRHEIETHLLSCGLCSDALEGLSHSPKGPTLHHVFELNHRIKKRGQRPARNQVVTDLKNWALAAFILFLLILASIIVWYNARQNQADKASNRQETTRSETRQEPAPLP